MPRLNHADIGAGLIRSPCKLDTIVNICPLLISTAVVRMKSELMMIRLLHE